MTNSKTVLLQIRCSLLMPLFVMLLILLGSCKKSSSEAAFRTVFVSGDSLTSYSLDIYARVVDRNSTQIPVEIIVTAPSGATYTDILYLSLDRSKSRRAGRWVDSTWRYREGVRFPENGEWRFSIRCKSERVGLRDGGIIIKQALKQ